MRYQPWFRNSSIATLPLALQAGIFMGGTMGGEALSTNSRDFARNCKFSQTEIILSSWTAEAGEAMRIK